MRTGNAVYPLGMTKFLIPRVYPIANLDGLSNPLEYIERLFEAGASLVQLRAKQTSLAAFKDIAARSIAIARSIEARSGQKSYLIFNDHVELAKQIGADGVHLGQDDTEVSKARAILGPLAVIGLSTHSTQQVIAANDLDIDYIGFGPVFESPTKSGHAAVTGIDGVRTAAAASAHPIVAIGGITLESAPSVIDAGASSVAMISELERIKDLAGIF